ncbi:MAG: protein kinase [Desulfobacteraceae bacterium]|nr:protein kinase [Desulfobacteraceae bacterium]
MIGKYVVCGLLGRGGMGAVYKVRLPHAGRTVALKLLAPHPHLTVLLGNDAIRERFVSEASKIASFHHPNVIEILDFDFDGANPFFTMEYYCLDLGRLIGESRQPDVPSRMLRVECTIRYAQQILHGLGRLHRAGIVHRDIKPANLMITDEDCIKICDFGFSKLRGERMNRPGQLLVGSPYYAAPEQEKDPDAVDCRADLYSAGATIYRMLTGLLPEDHIRPPSLCRPDADANWDDFIARALASDQEHRFASAAEMIEALEELSLRWETRKAEFCRFAIQGKEQSSGTERRKLRAAPLKVRPSRAPEVFDCDTLMQPLRFLEDESALSAGDCVVTDSRTGLLWQRFGSEDPLDREDALNYIACLNEQGFGGRRNWRLPTANELLSTLKQPELGIRDCLASAFSGRQRLLWSSDRCTFVSGWFVNAELGFAACADFTCRFHVRATTEASNP